jgi:hypothetical protein
MLDAGLLFRVCLSVGIGHPLLVPLLLFQPFDRCGDQLHHRDRKLDPAH